MNCVGQKHNTVTRPGLEPGTFDPFPRELTIRPPRLWKILDKYLGGGYILLVRYRVNKEAFFTTYNDCYDVDVNKSIHKETPRVKKNKNKNKNKQTN